MSDDRPVELTEDEVPLDAIDLAVEELVDLYGGEIKASRENAREFTLPLRRGVSSSGAVQCTVSWAPEGVVTLVCDRNVDAPKLQRVLLLVAGVVGSVLFMLWPFFPHERAYGTLAWLGGIMAIAVYLMTLRKTSGGLAHDFLQRLVVRQRSQLTS
ncbi:MAG TPA: hypothetical protein VJZ00_08745 [Thermoanaerobaculia bacterium]|nr:hypothetical protein [Thermoanaerobaculia bacterium]